MNSLKQNNQILITGVGGFIGYHTANFCLNEGFLVFGLDHNPLLDESALNKIHDLKKHDNFTYLDADIRQKSQLQKQFADHKFDVIIHLAARTGVHLSSEQYEDYVNTNVTGTNHILDIAKLTKTPVLIASSSSVYGESQQSVFSEIDSGMPASIYAMTKTSCEHLAAFYVARYGMCVWTMRFFTVYGPHNRKDMAVFKFIDSIYNNKKITVYNKGLMRRDFTYVGDIVQGVMALSSKIIENNPDANQYDCFNIGGGREVSVGDLIAIIEKNLNKKASINFETKKFEDVLRTSADTSKLQAFTGFKPETSLEEGIKATCEWYLTSTQNN